MGFVSSSKSTGILTPPLPAFPSVRAFCSSGGMKSPRGGACCGKGLSHRSLAAVFPPVPALLLRGVVIWGGSSPAHSLARPKPVPSQAAGGDEKITSRPATSAGPTAKWLWKSGSACRQRAVEDAPEPPKPSPGRDAEPGIRGSGEETPAERKRNKKCSSPSSGG